MIISGFYDCVYALQKYRSYQKYLSDIALYFIWNDTLKPLLTSAKSIL